MKIYTPLESINKLYRKQPIDESEFSGFKDALKELFDNIEDGQVEPTQRKFFTTFMEEIFPNGYLVTHEEDSIDVVLHTGEKTTSPKGVLIELKSTTNKDEMVTKEDINRKALQELLFYYLNERKGKQNNSIKYLIACNIYECFVWDAQIFEKTFFKNKPLLKEYDDFVNKRLDFTTREEFYEQIAKKYIDEVKDYLDFTYINIQDCYKQYLHNSEKALIPLFKLLNASFLMKLPIRNDSNDLNNDFFRELLYIMGVEEWIDKETHRIRRIKIDSQKFSLMEQTWSKLDDYGISDKEQHFEIAMGLLITWINRILFLKLLESQLISFGNGEKAKFLTFDAIPDYGVLDELFMKVLAKPVGERDDEIKEKFSLVPYLNSSLFEMSALEQKYFPIDRLRLGEMEVYKKTVLKDSHGNKLKGKILTLEYLFNFLDAYDFGASKVVDGIRTEKKTLINASVLGLIFEKINGYKDGSFFTPGYITEYICHKTLRRAVINKFNEIKDWNCKDFNDLKESIGRKSEARTEANEIVNSLKICDPAVGSGHFLVSALNELIAIKSELGILQDRQERPMCIDDYDVRVENDELTITNEFDERFSYKPIEKRSRQIQEALFEEKRTIIENCLFGVDLNPKSVEICRLRLWIELLKNAYYYRTETGERVLQTLPNIDINIKCGNSILSRYPLDSEIQQVLASTNLTITKYKQDVINYKRTANKEAKAKLKNDIEIIKAHLISGLRKETPTYKKWLSVAKELTDMRLKSSLFGDAKNKKGKYAKELAKLEIKEAKLKRLVDDIRDNKTFANAFEWRCEIPEVLDDKGAFQGFDVIIGNPPYISLEKLSKDVKAYAKMHRMDEEGQKEVPIYSTLESRGDIYSLFVERGLYLLKKNGLLAYILPNKWMKVGYGKPLRQLFLESNLTEVIDFGDNQIFADATTYTCIIRVTNTKSAGQILSSSIHKVNPETLAEDIEERKELFQTKELTSSIWIISSRDDFEKSRAYKDNMGTLMDIVGEESYRGLLTGLSKAFNVSIDTANRLITEHPSANDILRPYMLGRGMVSFGKADIGSYLLFIPKGFTMKAFGLDPKNKEDRKNMPSEAEAWDWFENSYPSIAKWLFQFKDKAKKRIDKGDYWWELRACDYYEKFDEGKIIYQKFQVKPCFIYANNSIYFNDSIWFLSIENKSLLALLCSDMGWWLISKYCPRIQNGYQLIWDNLKQISVPSELPPRLGELADLLMQDVELGHNDDYKLHLQEVNEEVDKLYYEAIKGTVFSNGEVV